MSTDNTPNFDLGLSFDFSSSGDELLSSINIDSEESTSKPIKSRLDSSPTTSSTRPSTSSTTQPEYRFKITTATEKEQMLDNMDSLNTKKTTKIHIKVFRGLK